MRHSIAIIALLAIVLAACGCRRPSHEQGIVFRPAPGSFELCVLANYSDDAEALEKARDIFAAARNDAKIKNEFHRRAIKGEVPLPPRPDPDTIFVVFGDDCTYRWVPASDYFLKELGIDPEPATDGLGRPRYEELKNARERGEVYVDAVLSAIFWSRERGEAAGVDYFLLVRETPADRAIQADELEVEWFPEQDRERDILFRCDGEAREKIERLSAMNKPGKDAKNGRITRSIAFLIRGKIVSAALIRDAITDGRFMITMGKNNLETTKGLLKALRGE